jgi:HEAT repeat protein
MEEKSPARRRLAAEALGEIKPKDPSVVEVLTDSLKDRDRGVRTAAAKALEKIKGKK